MTGRRVRRNCPFCQDDRRDQWEQQIRIGLLEPVELDMTHDWPEGTTHRHMRRHSGEYHNNSNTDCPLCTHPERANIEHAVLERLVSMDDMATELDISEAALAQHMENHTQPIIQRQVNMEIMPAAIDSARTAMQQSERNLQRLNGLFNAHIDLMQEEQMESGTLDYKGLDTAVKLHREVRDSLTEIGEWLEKAEAVGGNEQVSVLTVIQAHFSEKSPEEWRVMRKALAEAGVLEDG
jgi:hypothetical protein